MSHAEWKISRPHSCACVCALASVCRSRAQSASSSPLCGGGAGLAMAAAEEPDRKRARRGEEVAVVPSYKELDVDSWTTFVRRSPSAASTYSSPLILVCWGPGGVPQVSLSPRGDPRGRISFKVDLGEHQQPDKVWLCVDLSDAQASFLERLDDWAKRQALVHAEEWFGAAARGLTAAEVESKYTPLLKRPPGYPPRLRSKVVLDGPPSALTRIAFQAEPSLNVVVGAGWDFLAPLLGERMWRGNEVRVALSVKTVWVMGGKFGLSTQFASILVAEASAASSSLWDPRSAVDFPELEEK